MNKSRQIILILSIVFALFFAACVNKSLAGNDRKEDGKILPNPKKDCPKDLLCTMDYKMIVIDVKEEEEGYFYLDSVGVFYTDQPDRNFYLKSYEEMITEQSGFGLLLAEDANMMHLEKTGTKLTMAGFKGGKEVFRQNYIVGHDCCHVVLLSGPKEILLKQSK